MLIVINTFQEENVMFVYNENTVAVPENYMDRWILSFTQSLIKFVKEEMKGNLIVIYMLVDSTEEFLPYRYPCM